MLENSGTATQNTATLFVTNSATTLTAFPNYTIVYVRNNTHIQCAKTKWYDVFRNFYLTEPPLLSDATTHSFASRLSGTFDSLPKFSHTIDFFSFLLNQGRINRHRLINSSALESSISRGGQLQLAYRDTYGQCIPAESERPRDSPERSLAPRPPNLFVFRPVSDA